LSGQSIFKSRGDRGGKTTPRPPRLRVNPSPRNPNSAQRFYD
jgi:hypothetical protein